MEAVDIDVYTDSDVHDYENVVNVGVWSNS